MRRTPLVCALCWAALTVMTVLSLRFSWLVLLSSGLTVAVLYIAAIATDARGWPLFGLLGLLYGGIGVVNIQIENLSFTIGTPAEIARSMMSGLAVAGAMSAAIAWAITRDDSPRPPTPSHRLAGGAWWRVPLVGLIYVVIFFTAGASILPFIREFYASSSLLTMPPVGTIVATEFVRGSIFALVLLPLLWRMDGRPGRAAIVAGLALVIFGGLAPLLLPVDDIFPMSVRRFHMVEIGVSNSLLGAVVATLFVRRGRSEQPARLAAPA